LKIKFFVRFITNMKNSIAFQLKI